MFNLDKFLKGEIAYIVDRNTVDKLLETLDCSSDLCWISGSKPMDYNPFESCCMRDDDVTTVGMFKNTMGCTGIGHGEMMWFKSHNYKVEVF